MKVIGLLAAAVLTLTAGGWTEARAADAGKASRAGPAGGRAALTDDCLGAHGAAATAGRRGAGPAEIVAVGASNAAPHAIVKVTASHGAPGGAGCDACADWTACEAELKAAGAGTQVVPLKNGVMCVYLADTPRKAHEIQLLLARHRDYLATLASAGDKAHLCPYCREMRGAVVSGKLVREVINIDGGCIVMTTSPDPFIVARLRAEAGVPTPGRVKS